MSWVNPCSGCGPVTPDPDLRSALVARITQSLERTRDSTTCSVLNSKKPFNSVLHSSSSSKFEAPVSENACRRTNTTLLSLLTGAEVEPKCSSPQTELRVSFGRC